MRLALVHVYGLPSLTIVILLTLMLLANKGFYVNYFLLRRTRGRVSIRWNVFLLLHFLLLNRLRGLRAAGRRPVLYCMVLCISLKFTSCLLDNLFGNSFFHQVHLCLPDEFHQAVRQRNHRLLRIPIHKFF